ncbi:MAG: nuclear transport factor 2 family protein [Solirubrobacterales bacterium]|nr:nuclear transport factor 2 family protein [Solirubrobacterales bacterium]
MSNSPIEQLLEAIDRLDVDGVSALLAPDARCLSADGRRAEGREAVRELIGDLLTRLRSATHRITSQWRVDDVWIAEVDATYELQDWLQLNDLPRVFVLRMGAEGIADLRVYGAHEHPLTEHRTGEEGMWVGSRWIPPL